MIALAFSAALWLLQAKGAGVVVGAVKLPTSLRTVQSTRVLLLPPKYTELWNRQVQIRLDNYWELYKPEFAARKERFVEFSRAAQVEGFRYITAMLQRDLGSAANAYMKESSAAGQFEFKNLPLQTYELLVETTIDGQDVILSKTVPVTSDVPVFVDLGQPPS